MIIKCKVCKGSGRVSKGLPFFTSEVCEACKGAGELELLISDDKLVTCKFCNGKGLVSADVIFGGEEVCPACKGIGVIERPIVRSTQAGESTVSIPQTPRLKHYEFDIAISYASEDHEIVQQYVDILTSKGLKVFYDKYDQVGLWGTNLYDKLDEVYRTKALFCVIFISKYYAEKVWTNHERKSAQARALQENREYVLPVRLDDTEISGILPTVGVLDLREISIDKLVDMTVQKVKRLKSKHSSG